MGFEINLYSSVVSTILFFDVQIKRFPAPEVHNPPAGLLWNHLLLVHRNRPYHRRRAIPIIWKGRNVASSVPLPVRQTHIG